MLYFPIFLWSFAQMCASLMYLIILFIFFFWSLSCLFIIYSFPMKHEGLYPHTSIFLGNKVTQSQISVMKVILSLWLASKSNWRILLKLSDFVYSPPIFCIYHWKVHGFKGTVAQDSYYYFSSSIKFVMLESKGISWEVIIYGWSRNSESKTVESFNSTIG